MNTKLAKMIVVLLCVVGAGLVVFFGWIKPSRLTPQAIRDSLAAEERLTRAPEPASDEAEEEEEPAPTPSPEDEVKYFRELVEPPTDESGGVPDTFLVRYHCSNGDFIAAFHKDWAPLGVERVYELVKEGVHNDARFFRVVPGFIVQWGIPARPSVIAKWKGALIKDEPLKESNTRGRISFAKSVANSRSMQLFVNLADNSDLLDSGGFAPVGEVIYGMETVATLNDEYEEEPGRKQKEILAMGNMYLDQEYPNLDYIKKASFVVESDASDPEAKPIIVRMQQAETEKTTPEHIVAPGVAAGGETEVQYFRELAEAPTDDKGVPPTPFMVRFKTSKGDFVAGFHKHWAPRGYERVYQLVKDRVFDEARFFRVVPGFVVQFGIPAKPSIGAEYRGAQIRDDLVNQSNTRGTISFAAAGPNTRTMQLFINYQDNTRLDGMGFSPVGKVYYGMEVVDSLNAKYGEQPGQYQNEIMARGNEFLDERFPGLDYIKEAVFVEMSSADDPEAKPLVYNASVTRALLGLPAPPETVDDAESPPESSGESPAEGSSAARGS